MATRRKSDGDPLHRGLPSNLDAEKVILGAVLVETSQYVEVAAILSSDDFTTTPHKKIFMSMGALADRGETIDRLTIANELMRAGDLEAAGGLAYLISLDEALPQISDVAAYARIVKEKSQLRRLIYRSQAMIQRATFADDPAADIAAAGVTDLIEIATPADGAGPAGLPQVIEQFPGGYSAFLDPSKQPKGIQTGLRRFDELTGGLRGGELIIIGGRTGHGKSSLAAGMTIHAAFPQSKSVVIFSLEMSRVMVFQRLICQRGRIDLLKYRNGYLNADERRMVAAAVTDLSDVPIRIDDSQGLTLAEITARLRRLQASKGVDLAIVDYLQLMRGQGENRTQEVSSISRGLKLLAMQMNIPIVALSQVRRFDARKGGNLRPELDDLRESGSISSDSDLVAFIFREELHQKKENLAGVAELIVKKQRNGPTFMEKLAFLRNYAKFESIAYADDEAEGA